MSELRDASLNPVWVSFGLEAMPIITLTGAKIDSSTVLADTPFHNYWVVSIGGFLFQIKLSWSIYSLML